MNGKPEYNNEQFVYKKMDLYRRIVQAKLYIDRHFNEKLDLDNIAEEAFFSKFHFLRVFKESYGLTPHHYLLRKRLDQAKLLLAGEDTVFEISIAIGFESPTAFTAAFKKYTSLSPSAYREHVKRKDSLIKANPLRGVPNCFAETHGWKNSNF